MITAVVKESQRQVEAHRIAFYRQMVALDDRFKQLEAKLQQVKANCGVV
ncbi:hypothetical protein [Spirosoma validum]|uniref:Uncharacterized protein n=1 Tax=Spirosoma validum TaxID=2771355 RepID=A0A927B867_9BACT|nr:hypothetical protein [Spirosoma validum]MBD2756991.1 hypothetical protein [Spirosoma validum]